MKHSLFSLLRGAMLACVLTLGITGTSVAKAAVQIMDILLDEEE